MENLENHSPQYFMALKHSEEHCNRESVVYHDMQRFLDTVDEEVLEGYQIHKSSIFPGVGISTVSASARNVAERFFGQLPDRSISNSELPSKNKVEIFLFPSVPPPFGDASSLGYIFGAINKELPKILNIGGAEGMDNGTWIP